MDYEDLIEEEARIQYFESKSSNQAIMSGKPGKKSHSEKRCCCGGHSTNDGDKQYKGRQFEKHTERVKSY